MILMNWLLLSVQRIGMPVKKYLTVTSLLGRTSKP